MNIFSTKKFHAHNHTSVNVLFFSQNGPLIAASRTRVFSHVPFLEAAGIKTRVHVAVPDALFAWSLSKYRWRKLIYYLAVMVRATVLGFWVVLNAHRYHVIVIQRVLLPAIPAYLLRRFRHKVIFDFDDAIFTTEKSVAGLIHKLRDWQHKKAMPRMLRTAGQAIVENQYTKRYALQYCPQVTIMTGPIDTDRYAPGPAKTRSEVVLGWIGSPSTTPYLELIREPLEELGRRHRHLKLCLIGADTFELTNLPITHQTWALETEVAHLRAFDIGLMPLPDDAWTRGKGGYKLLQYMAMGLPVIASPVEINREIVAHDINGFLAETPEEWVAYLERLIGNAHLRQQMGAAGRRHVVVRYSLKESSRYLLEILQATQRRSFKTG